MSNEENMQNDEQNDVIHEELDLSSDQESLSDSGPAESAPTPVEQDPYLEEAIKHGYDPNYNGPGKKSPKEYVDYGRAYEVLKPVINGLKEQIIDQKKSISTLNSYYEKAAIKELEKEQEEINAKLAHAEEYGNIAEVKHYTTKQLEKANEAQQKQLQLQQQQRMNVVQQFVERNKSWYNEQNPDLVDRVREIDQEIAMAYAQAGRPISYEQLARQVELQIKSEMPERVIQPVSKPLPVLSNSPASSAGVSTNPNTKIYNSLPAELKQDFKVLSKNNKEYWTVDRFIKKLKERGEI